MSENIKRSYHQLGDDLIDEQTNRRQIIVFGEELQINSLDPDENVTLGEFCFTDKAGELFVNNLALSDSSVTVEGTLIYALSSLDDIYVEYIFPPAYDLILSNKPNEGITASTQAKVVFSKDSVYIYPNGSLVYYNRKYVSQNVIKKFEINDEIFVGNYLIKNRGRQWEIASFFTPPIFNEKHIFIEDKKDIYPLSFPEYRRSPRVLPTVHDEKIRFEKIKNPSSKPKNALWRAALPPIGMVILAGVVTVLMKRNPVMMLTMGGMSVMTAAFSITNYFSTKKDFKENELMRVADYEQYLLKHTAELEEYYLEEKNILYYQQPRISELEDMAIRLDSRIYERLSFNEDFMQVALGIGDVKSQLDLSYHYDPLNKDDETVFAQKLLRDFEIQRSVPVTINLNETFLGIVAGHDLGQRLAQTLIFQLAVFHSYRDVNFVALVSEEDYQSIWKTWRFLPHFDLAGRNVRGIIHDERSKDAVLTSLYQLFQSRLQVEKGEDTTFLPHIVVLISDDRHLTGHVINEYLSRPDLSQYGVTVIWLKESKRQLPETVNSLAVLQSSSSAHLINDHGIYINQAFDPYVEFNQFEMAVRSLANLNHVETQKNSLPDSMTFLEMYGVTHVNELDINKRWEKADTSKSLAVPLGVRGKDDIIFLNLHERAHGPHGLVAGTTGSGKSEILQSYILSLALNFSPEDIGFLPIDFKGGGMANLFRNLPHLMGSITNLDGAGTQRALASIRAELQKRQRLFGKFGVNHINGYTKLYKQGRQANDDRFPTEPLPHLFLISDEFAELKQNEPEFMNELVSTARIGRSLGIHLILATQKPSGVVNDQIWSNSRFKLALKVADKADSKEIIKTPDAASITQPGRAYLQVGNNEIYELFQSAWSGAAYNPSSDLDSNEVDKRLWVINELGQYELATEDLSYLEDKAANLSDVTELDAIVNYISDYTSKSNVTIPEKPWLPPLEYEIVSPILETQWCEKRTLQASFAFMDVPSEQTQYDWKFDLEEMGHTIIFASPGYGKSQALQTLIMNFSRVNNPEQMHFYLFDFGTNGLLPLRDLPHVADLVTLDEGEKLLKALKRIREILKARKELLAEYGVASIDQYEQKSGESLPIIVNIIDLYDTIRENSLEVVAEATFNQVLREGSSLGVYLIVTALRSNSLKLNMRSNFASQLVLYLVDKDGKKELVGFDALPDQEIAGRGQIRLDNQLRAFQIYLSEPGRNDIERLRALEADITSMTQLWTGKVPAAIPMLPKEITFADFEADENVQKSKVELALPIGYDKETTEVAALNPKEYSFLLFTDDTPNQTYSLEKAIVMAFASFAGRVDRVVIDLDGRFEKNAESFDNIITEEVLSQFMGELLALIRSGQQKEKPMYIYFPDIHLAGDKISLTEKELDSLFKKGSSVGIHLIFHGYQNNVETKFTPFFKRLRQNIPAGTFGTISSEQKLVSGRHAFNEPLVALDETQLFKGREIYRVRFPQDE
ncbi:type VII secretion protein EssC [Streptococcus pantholopis]|uniref:Type VII secretion protein EssC n=1 Tax=Streptococcus pantholopis TaxID=1811193 RepID=A0A172Q4Z2_9STRE|nr:type VII secretion protein EssC [Streptococcus pantholopis]AND78523.1 type VII secretion protein EssC [Streptococcus pantholopis]